MADRDWRAYQREVADAFREAGFTATVDAVISGARATHRIDVLIEPNDGSGTPRRWLAECKYQRRNVTKAVVLTLKGALDDIGAERGFVVSETAFQPAAVAAADNT